jgi:succinoglycan biosynthesis protein ExoV
MLYYFEVAHGNFGDDLNPWLWSRLAPELCDPREPALFLGIGTVLSANVPAEPLKVLFGPGCSAHSEVRVDDKWTIHCVRGPLTAAKLNLDRRLGICDPAILIRRTSIPQQKKTHRVAFMPHHRNMLQADWQALCRKAGIHCIDPGGGVDHVLAELGQTELLLAEAMHGAIVADALRVPWIPVRIYDQFNEFKWRDWTQSIQSPFRLATAPQVFSPAFVKGKGLVHGFKKGLARARMGKEKWRQLPMRASRQGEIDRCLAALLEIPRKFTPSLSAEDILKGLENELWEKLCRLRETWPPKPLPG